MSIIYTWSITKLDCYPEQDGNPDVVFVAYWRLNGTDGEYSAHLTGSAGLPDTEGAFTPFDELTEAQVLGWVFDALGLPECARLEDRIATQIEGQINPPVVSPPLPWEN